MSDQRYKTSAPPSDLNLSAEQEAVGRIMQGWGLDPEDGPGFDVALRAVRVLARNPDLLVRLASEADQQDPRPSPPTSGVPPGGEGRGPLDAHNEVKA